MGFDAVQVFKKRNKALKKIHKLVKKGTLKVTEVCKNKSDVGTIDNIYCILLLYLILTPGERNATSYAYKSLFLTNNLK